MKYELSKLDGLKRKLDIQLPVEQVKKAFNDSYRKKQKTAVMPGFRKGKMPLSHIRFIYQDEVEKDTVVHLINKFYLKALEQEGLFPAGQPKINLKSDIAENKEFGFSALMEVHPEILIDKNFKVRIAKPKILIEDKQVDQFLEKLLKNEAKQENEEFFKKFKCKNIQEMKSFIRKLMTHEKQTAAREQIKEEIFKQLVEKHPIALLPEKMVEDQKQVIISSVMDRLKSAGMPEQERQQYKKKYQKDFHTQARFMVRSSYLIYALAEKLNISANQKEIKMYLQVTDLDKNPSDEDYKNAENLLIKEKTIDHLIDTALPGETEDKS